MDVLEKIEVLGEAAQHDICKSCGPTASRTRGELDRWIYPAVMPDGRTVRQLKVLLSNACENDCFYCAHRRGRDARRMSFRPGELARIYAGMYERGLVQGLFLSSAVCGRVSATMDRMIAAAEILRRRYQYRGYIHLKILPGADTATVERAALLATRVSVNLEAPNPARLARLTGSKSFHADIMSTVGRIRKVLDEKGDRAAPFGQTTQLVVGPAGETDSEILSTTAGLYRDMNLVRVYYSAFQPIDGTPLEGIPATPLIREHRLYQSDFLLRKYEFSYDELIFDGAGNLPTDTDPKTLWAFTHPERYPIEVNKASREELLRVPGIGPTSARRIVRNRRRQKLRTLRDLQAFGALAERTAPFILLNGKRPPIQLDLFDRNTEEGQEILTGQGR